MVVISVFILFFQAESFTKSCQPSHTLAGVENGEGVVVNKVRQVLLFAALNSEHLWLPKSDIIGRRHGSLSALGGSGKKAKGEGGDRGWRKSQSLIGALRSLSGGGGVIGLTLRQVCFSLTHTHAHPASFRSALKNDEVRCRVATAAADGSHTTESQFASFTRTWMREVHMHV